MYGNLLVPLDGSPLAEAALPHAVELARCFEAKITLLQVATTVPMAGAVDPLAATGAEVALAVDALEATERAANEYLEKVARLPVLQGLPVETAVARGRPAREIIRWTQEQGIDLIVMSTHGRSGLGRLVFGSVANQVLREAGVPILLIRPTE